MDGRGALERSSAKSPRRPASVRAAGERVYAERRLSAFFLITAYDIPVKRPVSDQETG